MIPREGGGREGGGIYQRRVHCNEINGAVTTATATATATLASCPVHVLLIVGPPPPQSQTASDTHVDGSSDGQRSTIFNLSYRVVSTHFDCPAIYEHLQNSSVFVAVTLTELGSKKQKYYSTFRDEAEEGPVNPKKKC